MNHRYQICIRCIMDTSDPDIVFSDEGICSHCLRYQKTITNKSFLQKKESGALEKLIDTIKHTQKKKPYDCIIGVSGGVDSTYVAYVTRKILGLRPLAVHLDNGWDSEYAVRNIYNALSILGIELITHVINWEEFRDLQCAFLKASTPDAEIPTDHAILAILYRIAVRYHIPFILSGHNTATEGGGVAAWSQGHADSRYIQSIHRLFGARHLDTYPMYGPVQFFYYAVIKNIQWIPILDYLPYNKNEARTVLEKELKWQDYGGKHCESIYTRFYQGYYLPKKFGFEKKRLHLSSLIWSEQLTRDAALKEMTYADYSQDMQESDKEYVIKKLNLTPLEFESILSLPPKQFWDYPSYKKMLRKIPFFIHYYHRLKRT